METQLTHSEKIRRAKQEHAHDLNQLQEGGMLVTIKKIGKRNFQVVQNFEVLKEYRLRRSARVFVKKINPKTSLTMA